ncbi:MAG: ABC transporter permease [Gemmatimonadota bacterium]|nr:ABC transporter permease [Gemmatimonadota bacterium]
MNKVWAVIRREFIERVRTKAFLLSTLLFPVFIGAMMVLPALLLTKTSGVKRVAVLDGTSVDFGARVNNALLAVKRGSGGDASAQYEPTLVVTGGERMEAVRDSLIAGIGLAGETGPSLNGVLILTDEGLASGRLQYFGDNAGSISAMQELEGTVRPLVTRQRLEREGVDPMVVMRAIGPVSLATQRVAEGKLTGQSGGATFAIAYAMGFILYMALLIYGIQVMTSIVEEKSNRIMEVLASSMSPFQMLLGKILGVGSVAFLQLGIWAGAAYAATTYRVQLLGLFGVDAAASSGVSSMIPSIPGSLLVVFLAFFVLGFLLYSAMFAAVGSMCNTVQETQQAQFPVMFLIILGLMTMFALLNDPNSPLVMTLSYVPFWTPFVIPIRYSMAPIPIMGLLVSAVITILGMLAIVWVASRIYRVGILSYGKRASLRDLWRWVRTA